MHANRYWWIFLACVAAAVCWKSGVALYRLYGYYRLSAHAEATLSNWAVVQVSEESYVLKTHYRFQVKQKDFENDYLFFDRPYLNAWGAEQEIKRGRPDKAEVWYAPSDPLVSSLQKNFPFKECLSVVALWALFLYFIWLGKYVASYGSNRPQKPDRRP